MAIEQGKLIEFQDIADIYNSLLLGLPYQGLMGSGDFSSKDFNDYIVNGIYSNGGTNQGYVNAPHPADNGYLIVVGEGFHQIWFSEFQLLPVMHRCLTSRSSNTWSDWSNLGLNVNLLWANSSISSEFPSQSISLGLSKYKFIIVDVLQEYVSDNLNYSMTRHKNIVMKNEKIALFSTNNLAFEQGQNFYYSSRYCIFDNDGIEFGNCYSSKVNSTSAYTSVMNNLNCVPYKIYGVE